MNGYDKICKYRSNNITLFFLKKRKAYRCFEVHFTHLITSNYNLLMALKFYMHNWAIDYIMIFISKNKFTPVQGTDLYLI